jgi:hypothetical protein
MVVSAFHSLFITSKTLAAVGRHPAILGHQVLPKSVMPPVLPGIGGFLFAATSAIAQPWPLVRPKSMGSWGYPTGTKRELAGF